MKWSIHSDAWARHRSDKAREKKVISQYIYRTLAASFCPLAVVNACWFLLRDILENNSKNSSNGQHFLHTSKKNISLLTYESYSPLRIYNILFYIPSMTRHRLCIIRWLFASFSNFERVFYSQKAIWAVAPQSLRGGHQLELILIYKQLMWSTSTLAIWAILAM